MRQRFQILSDPRFRLVYNETRSFIDGPAPNKVRLNREGFTLLDGIKKKTKVYPGMLLATHPSVEKGDLHSPMYGEITEINYRSIFIDAVDPEGIEGQVDPVDVLAEGKEGEELILQMKQMGVNTKSLAQEVDTLIINGLNPDPGVTWAEPMLTQNGHNLHAGIELHKRFAKAKNIVLAVPKGMHVSYDNIEVVYVEPEYPKSVNALLIQEITGKENPEGVGAVGLHNLWSLGRVGVTGLPLMETVITIGSQTQWANLDFSGIDLHAGDTVLRGGPLRGECLDRFDRSITKGTTGLFVIEAGTVPPMEGHSPCVNCGACVQVCPAHLNPSTLSRYAEFANYNACYQEHSENCLECGLCGYVCIARRPVLQYIRLANAKIKEMREFVWEEKE